VRRADGSGVHDVAEYNVRALVEGDIAARWVLWDLGSGWADGGVCAVSQRRIIRSWWRLILVSDVSGRSEVADSWVLWTRAVKNIVYCASFLISTVL